MDYDDKVKMLVKELLDCRHTEASNVTRMLHAKVKIENDDFKGALESMLELVLRLYGIEGIKYNDDLVRMLNTRLRDIEPNQTIRERITSNLQG